MNIEPSIGTGTANTPSVKGQNKNHKNRVDIESKFDEIQKKLSSGELSDTQKDTLINEMEGIIGQLPDFDLKENKLANTSIFNYSKNNSELT